METLLIEDDPQDVTLIQIALAESYNKPHSITHVDRLGKAIEQLKQKHFDVAIVDLALPDSKGINTVKTLITHAPSIPIVILTGSRDESLGIEAVHMGAQDYVSKDQLNNRILPRIVHYAIERKQSHEELRKSEEKFHNLIENSGSSITYFDMNHRLIFANSNASRDFGVKKEDLAGKSCFDIFPKEQAEFLMSKFLKVTEEKKGESFEYCTELSEEKQWLLMNTQPVKDSKGDVIGIQCIATDITKRKQAEQKIKETMEMKSRFISIVSHELRTPLTAIKEGINIVLEGITGQINDEQKNFLTLASNNVKRLSRLINDVLDFQKIESGKVGINITQNNINDIIQECYNSMELLAHEEGIALILNLEKNLPLIYFDKDRIIQVLMNLLNNALKFTEKGSITICSAREVNGAIHVSVKDTGIGIKEEERPKLFQEFGQLQKGYGNGKPSGTGLGLAISKKIIEKHNGAIWVESQSGQGSTFHFILPPNPPL
ncbi:MAG: ATP-binding protein [bacterium]